MSTYILVLPNEILQMILEYCPMKSMLVCKLWYKIMLSTDNIAHLRIFYNIINKHISYNKDTQLVLRKHCRFWVKYIHDKLDSILENYEGYYLYVFKSIGNLELVIEHSDNRSKNKAVYRIRGGVTWLGYASEVTDHYGAITYNRYDSPDKLILDLGYIHERHYSLIEDLIDEISDIYRKLSE